MPREQDAEKRLAQQGAHQQREHGDKDVTLKTTYQFQPGNGTDQTCHLELMFQQGGEPLGDPIEIDEITQKQMTQFRDQLTQILDSWGQAQKERAA